MVKVSDLIDMAGKRVDFGGAKFNLISTEFLTEVHGCILEINNIDTDFKTATTMSVKDRVGEIFHLDYYRTPTKAYLIVPIGLLTRIDVTEVN